MKILKGDRFVSVLIIEGRSRIYGEISLQGSKNSVLPILAATVICEGESIIYNCPSISDVNTTIEILKYLGCKIRYEGQKLIIDSSNVSKNEIPNYFMRKMRSSIIFLGALISRAGSARLSLPGGCELGPRPVDMHFNGLRQMGLKIEDRHGFIECKSGQKLLGCTISLPFPSVGATENLILSAVKAKGVTCIINAAREPEIEDLANYLNKCGAKITGAGKGTVVIEGVNKLNGCSHKIIPDRIAAVTYMAAAAVSEGDLIINGVEKDHLASIIPVFEETNCLIEFIDEHSFRLRAPGRLSSNRIIRTMPYPGFPTDAQPPIMSMMAVSEGTSTIIENIFESRYKHVGELLRMGADIRIEGRTAVIEGTKTLYGADVKATDLRGAAALVVAGLCADGTTKISGLKHLDRGYDDIEGNLSKIGAHIKRV